jgi:hypothetical protein
MPCALLKETISMFAFETHSNEKHLRGYEIGMICMNDFRSEGVHVQVGLIKLDQRLSLSQERYRYIISVYT